MKAPHSLTHSGNILMKILAASLGAVALVVVQGCASITKGTTDSITVNFANCNKQTACTASNKKGDWVFSAPGSVRFKKSDNPLTITCQDGPAQTTTKVTPTRGGMAWGNVVFGGVIGGGIDSSTDAHWDIADSVTMYRAHCVDSDESVDGDSTSP